MIFHLNMNPGRLAALGVTNVDITGALEEHLMEACFEQPQRKVTSGVARLEVESFGGVDSAHGFGGEQRSAIAGLRGTFCFFRSSHRELSKILAEKLPPQPSAGGFVLIIEGLPRGRRRRFDLDHEVGELLRR